MSATDDAEAMRLWPGGSGWAGLIRVPTRFVQNYTVRGSAGRVGELDAEQPPGPGLYPVRRVRCSAVDGAQGKGASRVRSEIKVALRMSCCTVDRPVHGMRLRGIS